MTSAAVFGLFAGLGVAMVFIAIAYYVLTVVGQWKMFEKAGEPGWKSIIPFYNGYIEMKFSWKTLWFWVLLVLSALYAAISVEWLNIILGIAVIVLSALSCYKVAKAFGKGCGWAIGLFFLRPLFTIILGFGSAEYVGNSTPEGKYF